MNVVGSDFAAQEDIKLSAAHDVNVLPGHNHHSASTQEERSAFGFQLEKNRTGASLSVGASSTKDTGDQWEKASVQSNFTAGRDVQFNANHDVNMQATNVSADRDVNIDAGNNITLSESYNISKGQETHEKSFAGVTTAVNVGALGTVQDMMDAADRMNNKDGNSKVGNTLLTGIKINHLFNKGSNFIDWLGGNTGERGNVTKGLSSTLGGIGGFTKGALADIADASASVTVGFNREKAEASSHTSTAMTTTIEGGRGVNIEAHKGSIHGKGTDIFAGINPMQNNDAKSGNINLEAGQHIIFESVQNTQSTENNIESTSVNVGTSYGVGVQEQWATPRLIKEKVLVKLFSRKTATLWAPILFTPAVEKTPH
ncbi:hypothetical protein ABID23_001391 [Bartonella silvatica]|uniref:Filamentous hemagglutinin n=1 Tax=Bartonella silvatica TaxID=357760 RepID=A0ABV2HIA9_9HYPH